MRRPTDARERLLETTIILIGQSSYAQVGINDICQQAGVTKGCFYHYFPSKAALFEAVCDYYWEKMRHHLDGIFSPANSAIEQLNGLIDFIIARQGASPSCPVAGCPFFTAGAQAGVDDLEIRRAATAMADKALRYNIILMRNLQAEGVVSGNHDPEQSARMMYYYIQGLLLYGRVHQDMALVRHDTIGFLYPLPSNASHHWRLVMLCDYSSAV